MDPQPQKSGFVSIVGRPNAGKSTLLNRLVGEKISIVTDRPQTTRTLIRGIVNRPAGQIIFVDTPGVHKPVHGMNERMMRSVRHALPDSDVTLLIVDATVPFGRGDDFTLDLVKGLSTTRFLLLNKTDALDKSALLPLIERYRQRLSFDEVIPISARNGDNVELLVELLFKYLPEGPPFYPDDQISDQHERNIVAEIIREKVILATRDELPYSTAVLIERFEEGDELQRIHANIIVERESQKPIIIGAGGRTIKEIGIAARRDLETFLGTRVYLELHVRVKEKWRDDASTLREIGLPD